MLESHFMESMKMLLAGLSAKVSFLDRDDESEVYAALSMHVDQMRDMTEGVVLEAGNALMILARQPRVCLYLDRDVPGASDILLLASALIARYSVMDRSQENTFTIYRRILRGELTGVELSALAKDYQIRRDLQRSVMVFHIPSEDTSSAYDILRDIVPMERTDVLVDMDQHSVALVRDCREDDSVTDSIQFAEALQETVMGETAKEMLVGIGESFRFPEEMARSFRQAQDAIMVGRKFIPEQTVFAYSRLILERFLMGIPENCYRTYQDMIFNPSTKKLFNDEMMLTIDTFLRKDLSVSDAARQLYIHRNTLLYRLDKVEHSTGLDLRKFEDAVVFKILMELRKNSRGQDNKSKRKEDDEV